MSVIAAVAGLLMGLSLGALGGGGSILAVPALVYLLGQSPRQAITASLLIVGAAAAAGAIAHGRAGRIRLREGTLFGALAIAGSYIGSRASAALPANGLLAGFGVLMLAVAGAMAARGRMQSRETPAAGRSYGSLVSPEDSPEDPPEVTGSRTARQLFLVTVVAAGVGLISGFFGVGGGFVVVPALVLILGFDMPAAVATSLVVITLDSVAALTARVGSGGLVLNWEITGAFTVAAMASALAGGRLAGHISPRRLQAAFAVLIVLVAGYTLTRSAARLA
jgi:hypothetical protein